MKQWQELRLTVSDELVEALAAFSEKKRWPFYTKTWPDQKRAELRTYFKKRPEAVAARQELSSFIGDVRRWGLNPGRPSWRLAASQEKEWMRRSLQEFIPKKVSRHLVVKPSWKRYRPKRGEVVVEIDPQMAFGTGHHFTTQFCLKMLDRHGAAGKKVLDVGCGSGILGIAAAKLGASRVTGIDTDPVAVKTARENARKNRIEKNVRFRVASLESPSLRGAKRRSNLYDLVLANITAPVLLFFRRKIFSLVKPGGILIVTGILRGEKRKFLRGFASPKFSRMEEKESRLWCGFVYRRGFPGVV